MRLNKDRIKYEMTKQGLSPEGLSTRMGRVRTYAYYILGDKINPTLELVEEIAKALGIPGKDLIE